MCTKNMKSYSLNTPIIWGGGVVIQVTKELIIVISKTNTVPLQYIVA